MAQYQAFKRVTVQPQIAQKMETITFPAPMRGLALHENESYMQPGSAIVLDNWKPTLRGVALRGGCIRWCELPETTPIISGFEYASGGVERMFVGNATKLYDVSTDTPVEVKAGQTSGNYAAAQLANMEGDWLIVVNDNGDPPLRYDGTDWEVLDAAYVPPVDKPSKITVDIADYPDANVVNGANLVYVCKYRSHLFFIEANSMNAWYLPINAVGGNLEMIPLSGAATGGGKLLFCAVWSLDAGDGVDDKLVFATNKGELLIFTGSNPADPANWRQEGRFDMSEPLGMNAHIMIGGELLIATVEGILPTSGAITKSREQLELAALTRPIKTMWRDEMLEKRNQHWTMCRWDEYGGMFVAVPGSKTNQHRCLAVNLATSAWCRFTGWDAQCFLRMRGDVFFGTQKGVVMQADRTGYDDGKPYVATLVGAWEMFQSPSQTNVWRQARASFRARNGEPFLPQLSATVDYVVVIPQPPPVGVDFAVSDLWDEGKWDEAIWDKGVPLPPAVRNTGWVSIGMTGFSHAPIVQATVAQQARPEVELISVAATFERAGINV
jgi:hypothetical protein